MTTFCYYLMYLQRSLFYPFDFSSKFIAEMTYNVEVTTYWGKIGYKTRVLQICVLQLHEAFQMRISNILCPC